MEVLACIPELSSAIGSPAAATVTVSEPPWPADAPAAPRGRFFSPSIIVLVAVAATVWAAAWRNDRLRLETARQQRPERLAQELPPTTEAARSLKP